MRRFLTRLLLTPLALFFLLEAWLWDHLAPVVAALVRLIPLRRIKAWIRFLVSRLSSELTLLVFAVPAALLFPLKVAALWFLGKGYWLLGSATFVFAKLVGVGVTAFLFGVTKAKLLRMPWFRRFYEAVLRLRAAADRLVEPVKRRIRRAMHVFAPRNAGRTLRLLRRMRRRARMG